MPVMLTMMIIMTVDEKHIFSCSFVLFDLFFPFVCNEGEFGWGRGSKEESENVSLTF